MFFCLLENCLNVLFVNQVRHLQQDIGLPPPAPLKQFRHFQILKCEA